ncbi:MAG: cyclic nucleotide-binding domain-containing protein [Rhodospirillales bacterium]
MAVDNDSAYARKVFKKNDVILKEGDTSDVAYLILSGKVEVRKGLHGQNPRLVATLGQGHVIGELSLFDSRPHVATVIALEDTEVSGMSREEFQRMVNNMDPVMKGIVEMMAERLRQAIDELIPNSGDVNWRDWDS